MEEQGKGSKRSVTSQEPLETSKSQTSAKDQVILEGLDLTKVFGDPSSRPAVDQASLRIGSGSIHAIIGENGAGKSTLLKILFGHIHADRGQVFLDGERVRWTSPQKASQAGIGMVYQHFQLIDNLSALDNILLGGGLQGSGDSRWWQMIGRQAEKNRIKQLLVDFGWHDFPLEEQVGDLSLGVRQRLEILKLLCRNARILIMDEPTAVLAPHEIKALLEDLKRLKSQGKTIVLVTHKLPEVMAICDEVTVMRQGATVAHLKIFQTNEAHLASLMVGHGIEQSRAWPRDSKTASQGTEGSSAPLLSVRGLTVKDRVQKKVVLQDISFDVYPGEILGIAGVEGNGQTPLVEYLSHPASFNHVRLGRKRYQKIAGKAFLGQNANPLDSLTPRKLRAAGVGLIPEDRLHQGLVLPMSAGENLILGYEDEYYGHGFSRFSRLLHSWEEAASAYDIRPRDPTIPVGQLSGGNQQKLILARELSRKPQLIICCHPTRGVDWVSSERIYQELFNARDRGAGILLVSSSLDEIFRLATSIIVFYSGKIVGHRRPAQTSQSEIGFMMTGASGSDIHD